MTFFDKIYHQLFSANKNKVLSHETLNRSEKEKERFADWIGNEKHHTLLDRIHHAYHMKLTDIKDEIPIVLFRSAYANGFAIKNNDEILNKSFPFLLEYFKLKIVELGYRQAGSDKKVSTKEGYVLTVEKYYLKPPLQVKPPIDQLYGNIAIELHLLNDTPNYLKITASIYSDRAYKSHLDFDEMVEKIFAY
ncbi:hypothetical protein JKA74_12870 [Marivirga sp. S37H4]|uniref:Uncharacterized protein n=1 Tax=Marivirga aurantiaca TaxID=2802615 RepID=A0A934WZ80_9BACT|nr:hypothetical protein [Marivirga aurantiaca]MBK6265928.1 hypothetical protein [Marivirga aurantiaca]